jgi:hypothetical protein
MMKRIKFLLISILLLGMGASTTAWAQYHHHHYGGHVGIYVGAPLGWMWNYPPSYYYGYGPYPMMVAPSVPPTYIEQGQEPAPVQSQQAPSNYWYYCSKPDGYYPYVKQCLAGWQRVAPQPPSQP